MNLCECLLAVGIILSHSSIVLCDENDDSDDLSKEQTVKPERVIPYTSPSHKNPNIYIGEHFDDKSNFERRWVLSGARKPDVYEDIAQYDGEWNILPLEESPLIDDHGLVLVSQSRHAAISAKLDRPFVFDGKKTFILQYIVAFQKPVDCGGSYIKLITDGGLERMTDFNDKTPYSIMFGPDKCGSVGKLHFIIRHKNPLTGNIVEKHCTKLNNMDDLHSSTDPYLLKLIIEPHNDFAVYINNKLKFKGNILDDDTFDPPINPPKEVDDKTDEKPLDWDDREKIPDPNAVKPESWNDYEPEIPDQMAVKPDGWLDDEPETIPVGDDEQPLDWNEDVNGPWVPTVIDNPACDKAPGCGKWERPMIKNPNYKEVWTPPMIKNPDFRGPWIPRKIPNPDYYYDDLPLKSSPVGYVGFELWSLTDQMYFDDVLITDEEHIANDWLAKSWKLKRQKAGTFDESYYRMFLEYTNTYPYLWGVYIVVIAVIVGLIGSFFLSSSSAKADYEREVRYKKTDDDLFIKPNDENVPLLTRIDEARESIEEEEEEAQPAENTDSADEDDSSGKLPSSNVNTEDEDDDDDDIKKNVDPEEGLELKSSPSPPRKRNLRKEE